MRRQPKARSTKQAARIDRFHTLSAQTVSTFRGEADVQLDTGMKAHRQVLLTPATGDAAEATWVLHLQRLHPHNQQHPCMATPCSAPGLQLAAMLCCTCRHQSPWGCCGVQGTKVINFEGVCCNVPSANGSAPRRVLSDFYYNLQPGERLGIVGPNGAGKSTLLRLISGASPPVEGLREQGETVVTGFLTQDPLKINEQETIVNHIRSARVGMATCSWPCSLLRQLKPLCLQVCLGDRGCSSCCRHGLCREAA